MRRRGEGRAISGRFVVARPGKVTYLASDSAPGIVTEIDPSHTPGIDQTLPRVAGAYSRRYSRRMNSIGERLSLLRLPAAGLISLGLLLRLAR
jgi:hypothetical protein